MRGAFAVVLLALVANLAACGFLWGPQWCGAAGPGGPAVLPPDTPRPISTPDQSQLLCIAVENRSEVDMGLTDTNDGMHVGWSLIAACSGMSVSTVVPTGSWGLELGRAAEGDIAGSVLASFDSSQLTGEPPYLIAVVIGPDLDATIEQRSALGDPASGC